MEMPPHRGLRLISSPPAPALEESGCSEGGGSGEGRRGAQPGQRAGKNRRRHRKRGFEESLTEKRRLLRRIYAV